MQSFVCPISVSHHRAIIKLTRARIVDDVRYHSEYRMRVRGVLIVAKYLFLATVRHILKMRLRMCPVPLYSKLSPALTDQQ